METTQELNNLDFKSEKEFREWFEQNYQKLGYKEIILSQNHATPDYIVKTNDDKIVKLEVELLIENFLLHKHRMDKVDHILAYSTKKRTLKIDIPITLLKPFIPKIRQNLRNKFKTNWSLFLALIKFPTWKTKDFVNMGFPRPSVYKYRKYIENAEKELNEKLKK